MKVICVIDMQNDFITGSLGTPEAEIATQNVVKWIKENVTQEDKVYFTLDTHFSDYLKTSEGQQLPVKHCIRGTEGWDILPELCNAVKYNTKKVFYKYTFGCSELVDAIMYHVESHSKDINEIIFIGLCTDICIISNVLLIKEALHRDCDYNIPIKVIAKCCAGTTPENHEAALKVMKSCQIEIVEE